MSISSSSRVSIVALILSLTLFCIQRANGGLFDDLIQLKATKDIVKAGAKPLVQHGHMNDDRAVSTKGRDEISGFLGIGSLTTDIIRLKKPVQDTPMPEPDCVRTHFMHPFRSPPITFTANATVAERFSPFCRWIFIGTEACIPSLTCPTLNLINTEEDKCGESLEVFDGNQGLQKYCEGPGPINLTAADGLRDLFIKFRMPKRVGAPDPAAGNKTKLVCTVSCSNRGDGTPLAKEFKPKVNPFCTCGRKPNQNRIVNGYNSKVGEFPWQVALVETGTRQPFCGGSILNDRFILTAAHCIKGMFMNFENVQILMNGHVLDVLPNAATLPKRPDPKKYPNELLTQLDLGNGTLRFQVIEIHVHPLYVSETNDFDVAVIEVSPPINFTTMSNITSVCLPKLGSYLRTFAMKPAFVSGWGLPGAEASGTVSILQKLNVTVFPPKVCKEFYAHRVNRRMLCAGYAEGGRDSCMGDSGGPLIYEDRPQIWYQIGSVSWGEGCAGPKNPGVYIRTTESGQWLHYNSNSNDAVWCSVPQD